MILLHPLVGKAVACTRFLCNAQLYVDCKKTTFDLPVRYILFEICVSIL
jgi:hypothetical protein